MDRPSLRWAAAALSLSIATGLVVKACSDPELAESTCEKQEWATLHAIEFDHRERPLGEAVVRTVRDHEVLGLRGASGGNVWIMLKPASPPFYKQMPEGQYDVPAVLVERLGREHRLSYTVDAVLRSHVRQQ